jgi:hypothetical protein
MALAPKQLVMPRSLATKAKTVGPASGLEKGAEIRKPSQLIQAESVRSLRNQGRIAEAVRRLARVDGTTSAAVFTYVQVANSGYTIKAYDGSTHEFSAEGTQIARSVAAGMDTLYDYSEKFSDKRTMDALIESGLLEVVLTGAVAGELVLDKQRLPSHINFIPYEQITYKAKGDGRMYPRQQPTTGEAVDLDEPTVWIAESHKQAHVAYSSSMMESAIEMAFYFMEFIEDMRRAVRRSGHTRLLVKIVSEKVMASAPSDVQSDPKKLKVYLEQIRDEVVATVNSLEPEDALVAFDAVEMSAIKADGDKTDYKELLTALSGILATSLKSHPSILGLRLSGSQSLSNTESLVFLKIARSIQKPVEQFMSRALTLAVRLYGGDYYVHFRFDPIDLRPEHELEAFRTMRQQRILEQLSYGFITDEEAAEAMGTGVRPPGAPPLSGTMFFSRSGANSTETPDDPQGRALQPDTPDKAGGDSQ